MRDLRKKDSTGTGGDRDALIMDVEPVERKAPAETRRGDEKSRQLIPTRQENDVNAGGGRMGERLVALGLITNDQLNVALQEKKGHWQTSW